MFFPKREAKQKQSKASIQREKKIVLRPNLLLLGIDTSIKKGVLCLGDRKRILTKQILVPHSSSKELLPLLDALIKEKGLRTEDLEGIIVSLGPGSFTGLRIGLSLAKSLAFVLEIPLVGVPTLDTWATSAPANGIICPLCRAYGNKFYAGFYKKDREKLLGLSKYLFLSLKEIIGQTLEKFSSQKVTFLTLREGKDLAMEIKKIKNSSLFFLEETSLARALLGLGEEKIKRGEIDKVSTLAPLYVSSPKIAYSG